MDTPKPGIFARTLKTLAKIEPHEIKAVFLSFLFVLALMGSYYILRPIRDAMSSDWTDAELSTLFTATFIFSFLAVSLYGWACSKIKIGTLVPWVYGFFALNILGFYGYFVTNPSTVLAGKFFYVWLSVFSLFHVSVFWSFMADIFSKDQAPRLFGFIASGASIGAIVGPGLTVYLAGQIDKTSLMLVSTAFLLIPMGLINILEKIKHSEMHNDAIPAAQDYQQKLGANPLSGFFLLLKNPYLLGIAFFILMYTAISTFIYFELKNLLVDVGEAQRTQIWAGMDLAVNVLAIATALFATSRLATRFGLATTLALVPIVIIIGLMAVAIAPMIAVVIGLQVVRRAGNYAITRPAREMLFTAVDRESRFKAKSVIDVVVYRGGDAATAWAFTGLSQGLGLGLGAIALIGAGIAAVWALLGALLGKAYNGKNNRATSSDEAT